MTPGAAIPYGLRSSYLYDDANYATVADGNLQLIARRQPASASASCEYKRRNRESQRLHPAVRAVRGARQAARRSRVLARVLASQRHTYNDEIDVLEADWGRGSQRCRLRHSPRAGGRAPPDVLHRPELRGRLPHLCAGVGTGEHQGLLRRRALRELHGDVRIRNRKAIGHV